MSALIWKDAPAQALLQDGALSDTWDALNKERSDLPFLSSMAVLPALKVFGQGDEHLLLAHDGGRCVAMLLLRDVGKLRWQTFQPSQLPLGAWVAAAGFPVQDLASSLLHQGPMKLSLSVSITQVDPYFAPRAEDAADNRHDDYIDTAWVDIEGSFDDYWAARGKNLRQNMRKQRNKLEAESVGVHMRVFHEPADMPGAIARYGALEAQGWKAQEGTAIRPDNDQGRFYTEMMQALAAKGEASVYEYQFGDQTVAVNLCVQRGSTLTILKTTYDESIKVYSPAFLLNQDMMQALFLEQKIKRLEYYGSLMEWHTRWTDNRRTLYHLTTFRNGVVKRLAESLSARSSS